VLKSGLRFRTTLLLGVCASDASDPMVVGYLLELFKEGSLVGHTMLMWQASMVGFQQTLPLVLG
jgi:hypothetical protein